MYGGEGATVGGSVTVTVGGLVTMLAAVTTGGSVTVAVVGSMTEGSVTAGVDGPDSAMTDGSESGSGMSTMENGVEAAVSSSDSEFDEGESTVVFIGGRARRGSLPRPLVPRRDVVVASKKKVEAAMGGNTQRGSGEGTATEGTTVVMIRGKEGISLSNTGRRANIVEENEHDVVVIR